jgi:hypothetical protein
MTDEKRSAGTPEGYVAFTKEMILEFCRCRFFKSEVRALFAVLYLTYDDYRMEARVSIKAIEELTGLSRRMVIYALQILEIAGFILIERIEGNISKISINQDATQWGVQNLGENYLKQLQYKRDKYIQRFINQLQKDIKTK